LVPPLSKVFITAVAGFNIVFVVSSISNLFKPLIIPSFERLATPGGTLIIDILVSVSAAREYCVPKGVVLQGNTSV